MFAGTLGKEMFRGMKLEELKAGTAGSHPQGKPLRVRGTNTIGSRAEEGRGMLVTSLEQLHPGLPKASSDLEIM